jgi:Flp pilus assembly protein TadG
LAPTSRIRPDRKSQKGGSLVETVLVILTVISMIVFIFDMGRILLIEQYISERARVAARKAAVNNWNSTTVANFLCYDQTTAPSGDRAGYLGLLPTQVSYRTLGTPGTSEHRVQVKVSGVPVLTFIPTIAGQYTLPPIVATAAAQSLGATN